MRRYALLPCLLVALIVSGCQATPTALPVAEPPPAPECRWEVPGAAPRALVRAAVTALETEGFVIRDTDLSLGTVSADRSERIPAHLNPYADWPDPTWYGHYGIWRGGFATGMALGFGSLRHEATRLERVSVVVDGDRVRVSRDTQVIDWRGDVRELRGASDDDFCRGLRSALALALADEEGP